MSDIDLCENEMNKWISIAQRYIKIKRTEQNMRALHPHNCHLENKINQNTDKVDDVCKQYGCTKFILVVAEAVRPLVLQTF